MSKIITLNDQIITLAKNMQTHNPKRFESISLALNRVGIHDGNAVGWGVGALEFAIQQAYAVQHKPNLYRSLVPINTSMPETTETVSYRVYDYTGKGKRGSSKATANRDTSDIKMAKVRYEIYEGHAPTAEWGYMELLRCREAGIAIDNERLLAARVAYENHMDDVALFGEDGQPGLLNQTSVTTIVAPNGGTSGSNDVALMTPDEILALVNDSLTKVAVDSLTNEYPDTALLSMKAFQILSTRRVGSNSDVSILTYIQDNNVARAAKGISINFVPVLGLESISAPANPHRMVFYTNSIEKVEMALPMPIKFLAPENKGTDVVVHNVYTYGLPHVRYSKSMLYVDHN